MPLLLLWQPGAKQTILLVFTLRKSEWLCLLNWLQIADLMVAMCLQSICTHVRLQLFGNFWESAWEWLHSVWVFGDQLSHTRRLVYLATEYSHTDVEGFACHTSGCPVGFCNNLQLIAVHKKKHSVQWLGKHQPFLDVRRGGCHPFFF